MSYVLIGIAIRTARESFPLPTGNPSNHLWAGCAIQNVVCHHCSCSTKRVSGSLQGEVMVPFSTGLFIDAHSLDKVRLADAAGRAPQPAPESHAPRPNSFVDARPQRVG